GAEVVGDFRHSCRGTRQLGRAVPPAPPAAAVCCAGHQLHGDLDESATYPLPGAVAGEHNAGDPPASSRSTISGVPVRRRPAIVAVAWALCGVVLPGGCAGGANATGPTTARPSASPSVAVQTSPSVAEDPMASRFPAATARLSSLLGTMAIIVHDRTTGKYWRAGA